MKQKTIEEYLTILKEKNIEVPDEMFAFLDVLIPGAIKHGSNNWLEKNGSKTSNHDMGSSILRHAAEVFAGEKKDHESGMHPALHLATRALMKYTRDTRGIVHREDEATIRKSRTVQEEVDLLNKDEWPPNGGMVL